MERYRMTRNQLQELKKWFAEYTAGFYGGDEYVNTNLKLKEDHSRRTAENILKLADELGLNDEQKRAAQALGLLHDIGRFRQFITYRTYNDTKSENHSLLGVKVLKEKNVLANMSPLEREILEKAIEYHGAKKLPQHLDGEHRLFAQLIRDADKIDVLYVVTTNYKKYKNDPGGFNLELEFPDEPGCSGNVIDDILQKRSVDYRNLRTLNDMMLMFLAWVYDVNFRVTLRLINKAGYLREICRALPHTKEISEVEKIVFDYVDERIKNKTGN